MTGDRDPSDADADDRRADGLELAKSLTKATAGSTPAARKKRARRRRTDPELSGAHPDDRDPQLLGSMVEKLVGAQGWDLELRVRGVFARWPELVGDEIAAHTTPETFADGKLVVRTDSTAWATQLTYLVPTVLKRLNEDLGEGTVTLVEVLGPQGPTWKKGRLSSRDGRGPRDTYG